MASRSPQRQAPRGQHRFSSPSRPAKDDGDARKWRKLGLLTALSGTVQSLAWIVMSVAAALVFRGIIPAPSHPDQTDEWRDFTTTLTYLYFKEGAVLPKLPPEGLVTPRIMYRLSAGTLVVNVLWFITSCVMFAQVRTGSSKARRVSVRVWAVSTALVTALDVAIGAAMARDLAVLNNWTGEEADNHDVLSKCSATVMVIAFRGGLVLVANVVLMICLDRLAHRKSVEGGASAASTLSATKRDDGLLDAYRPPSDSMGILNPAFVSDEPRSSSREAQFQPNSFKPSPLDRPPKTEESPPSAGQKRLRRITTEELLELDRKEGNRWQRATERRQPEPSTPPPGYRQARDSAAPELLSEPRSMPRPDPRHDMRPDMRAEPRHDMRPDMRAEPRHDMRPELRHDMRPEPRQDMRPDMRAEPRHDMRAELRHDMRPDMRAEPRHDMRPEPRHDMRPDMRPEPRPDPRLEPRPERVDDAPRQAVPPAGHLGVSYLHGLGASQITVVPRVRLNPNAPKLPYVPEPDYPINYGETPFRRTTSREDPGTQGLYY